MLPTLHVSPTLAKTCTELAAAEQVINRTILRRYKCCMYRRLIPRPSKSSRNLGEVSLLKFCSSQLHRKLVLLRRPLLDNCNEQGPTSTKAANCAERTPAWTWRKPKHYPHLTILRQVTSYRERYAAPVLWVRSPGVARSAMASGHALHVADTQAFGRPLFSSRRRNPIACARQRSKSPLKGKLVRYAHRFTHV